MTGSGDPTATDSRPWGPIAAAAVALAVGAAVWSLTATQGPCSGGAATLESSWGDARRAALKGAVLATEHRYAPSTWAHLRPRLDLWAADWIETHRAVCLASSDRPTTEHTEPDGSTEAAMACLERARVHLDAFLGVLSDGEANATRNAIYGAAGLPSPKICASLHGPREPNAPAVTQRLAVLNSQLAQAAARANAGEVGTDIEVALQVALEARELGDTRLHVEAMLVQATLRAALGEQHGAQAALREAYRLGVTASYPALTRDAARRLVLMTGVDRAHYSDAQQWQRRALSQLSGQAPDPIARARLLANLAVVHARVGEFTAARDTLARALVLQKSVPDADTMFFVEVYPQLARAMLAGQRFEDAARLARNALTLARENLGEDHPAVAERLVELTAARQQSP
ncbi:MAG: tetratricopeptide repeat protein [Nannocystaceae bacterium]|nr:tetratricopeptide repeat protein [Nannocystaceae bacterium]